MRNGFLNWLKGFFRVPKHERLDLTRRGVLGSIAVGASGGIFFRLAPESSGKTYHPGLIRPPGSVEEKEFLARCIRCGECMKVCLTHVIQPAGIEFGVESLWTPVLRMNAGYCEYDCTLCSQVCPTDAIRPITEEEKPDIKIGTAFFDVNRCLPYAFGRSCIVCEEHCPVPDKAIWTREKEVILRNGERVVIKEPHVDPELCVGCGICEYVCPIVDKPGIYVTSVGETRHPNNQMLLDIGTPDWFTPASGNDDPYGGGGLPY